jgi:hypothetical protein
MRKTLGVLIFLLGAISAIPTKAGDAATVKCGANQDRVWVYDSLTAFDVQLKIKCGETVEIIGRSKGYVKIRTRDGSEGYVGDSAIPGLPPLEDADAKPGDANAPAVSSSLGELARRVVPHPVAAPVHASEPPGTVAGTVSAAQPVPPANIAFVNASTTTVNAAPSPAVPATVAVSVPVSSVTVAAVSVSPVPAPSATRMNTAATVSAVRPTPANESATLSAAAPMISQAAPSPVSPVASAATTVAVPKAKPVSSAASRPVLPAAKPSSLQPAAPNLNPTPAIVKPLPTVNTEMTANIPAPSPSRAMPGILKVSANADSEEYSDVEPVSESADPACQSYFSAYGLAPSQIKWLAENRKKEFPSICPAPDPSMVDFVVIFTHDVNAFNSALPAPVHTDRNGFSDFSATVGVDTAALSTSEADKAHRQFVWVFQMKRGAFNPATFSPRRRSQYAQVESSSTGSKAGVKSVEDAFEFAEQQQPTR